MFTARAAVLEAANTPFVLRDIELDEPRTNEVVVRMVAAGLCHTDLSVRAGALPFPLPGVLGHEGAGVVEHVGAAVTRVRPGDQVILTFTSCGRCRGCRGGHPAYCATWLPDNLIGGSRADGSRTLHRAGQDLGGHFFGQSSFSSHALVDERSVVAVGPDAPLESLAPLGCGVQTGVGAVLNVLRPAPDAAIAVFGAGAVGLCALIAATWGQPRALVAVDLVDSRLRLALELGATHTINPGGRDPAAALTDITDGAGFDHVIETTGNTGVLRGAVQALGVLGTCAVIGAPPMGAEVSLDVNSLIPGRRVVGVTEGDSDPETLIPLLARLYAEDRLPLDRLVTHYPFTDIEKAAHDVHTGTTIKPILRFGD
jgi:aryl-alcohol dehydrogenase